MKILNCNVRGLGLPEKRRMLRDFINSNNIDILCLQETKKDSYTSQFLNSISRNFDTWNLIPAIGSAGGLLFGFNSALFNSISWHIGSYSITVFVENKFDKMKWACTSVYGPVDHSKKNNFWNELTNLGLSWHGPWVIGGDFNAIRNRREKNGVSFDKTNMRAFNCWIDAFALHDFKCPDRQFTWARGGRSSQMACLDRYFVNSAWSSLYPSAFSCSFPRACSDHSPICLEFGPITKFKSTLFRFEKCWLTQEGFAEMLANWWHSITLGMDKVRD
jgi:exonuclease III